MRTLQRLALILAVCTLLAGMQFSNATAGSQPQELNYNPDAETYIRDELLNGRTADLSTRFTSQAERTVRAEYIVSLWQDPELESISVFKISNVIVTGDLDAEGISIPFRVGFENCTFNGRLNLDGATTKTFRLDNCTMKGSVRLGRINVEGDLALYGSTFEGEVTLFDASISSNLFARGSSFLGTVPDPSSKYPFELWKTQVGQSTEFSDSVIKGEASAEDAEFGVDVRFDGVTFEGPAWFTNIQVGELADFQEAVFEDTVSFESSTIDRDIQFKGATFEKRVNFDYLFVERFFDFNEVTVHQEFSLQYPNVGWPYFESTVFKGPVNFEGMQTANDFDFTNATYEYGEAPFKVFLARVDGQALFNGFASPTGLDLSHSTFGDLEISGKENSTFEQINLESTVINGDLILDKLEVNALYAKELEVQDKTTITRFRVIDELNLSNASLGFFTMDNRGFWPVPTNQAPNFNLRGMVYNDIGLVTVRESLANATDTNGTTSELKEFQDRELDEHTWGVLLRMVNQSEYSPQAYRTLGQFLTEKGRPEWAAIVEFNRKDRERREILVEGSGPWFWSWFSYLFSGYGQIPGLALIWSVLVITIGAILYWREQDLLVMDQSEAKPVYNPFLYSFALFAPFIELDIAEKWEPKPERRVAWIYKYILKILGWILTPIALLTFGGVIQ